MALTIIPAPMFLPQESVKLGRFIVNIERPHEGYYEPISNGEPKSIPNPNINSTRMQDGTDGSFGAALMSLMSAGFSKRAKTEVHITPALGTEYILDNSDAWFDNAIRTEESKRWLEKAALRGKKIYMIVGIQTVTDARIVQSSGHRRQLEGQVTVPTSLSLAAAGIVVPLAGLIDPDVHGEYQSFRNGSSEYLAPGEQVCALQYRKISYKRLSSRAVDTMHLNPTRYWSCMEGDRRSAYEQEEDDADENIINVELLNVDEVGTEWSMKDVGERRICICA